MKSIIQQLMFLFLNMGRVAEGEIGVNWFNIIFMVIIFSTAFFLGRTL